jgi:predicted adenine nucleotide alpha hydrolase (AANH) superfamily ATPase
VKLLLHCCCGPCAALVAERFRAQGHDVTGWFFNPNIHPVEERRRRQETMRQAAEAVGLPLQDGEGGSELALREFLLRLALGGGKRCESCYEARLRAAAEEAVRGGFDAFATTLSISPYQDLAAIERIGREAAAAAGTVFLFEDLRSHYPESCDRARELDLYRQKYCGCVFSAFERAERRARRALEKTAAKNGARVSGGRGDG